MTRHLMDSITKPLRSKHPGQCHSLPEADPEERHSTGGVEIHQLEHVDSTLEIMVMVNSKDLRYLGTHGETSAEAEDTHQHSKLLAVRSEQVRPVVHQTRD